MTDSLLLKKQVRLFRPHLKICTLLLPAASRCEIKITQTAERLLILAGPEQRARKTGRPTAPTVFMPATSRTNAPANSSTSQSQDKKRTIYMPKLATPPNPIPKINLPSPSSLAPKKVHWRVCHDRCEERLKCEEAARWIWWPPATASSHRLIRKRYRCWRCAAIKRASPQRRCRAKWPGGGLNKSMKDLTKVSQFKSFPICIKFDYVIVSHDIIRLIIWILFEILSRYACLPWAHGPFLLHCKRIFYTSRF